MKTETIKTGKNRLPNGQFKKGCVANPKGRPVKPEIELLRNALEAAQTKQGMHLIEFAVEKAYTDNQVLIAILKKILPDKIEGDMKGGTNVYNIISRIQQDFISGNSRSPLELDRTNGVDKG